MSDEKRQHGRREAPRTSGLRVWWSQYRQWIAGMSRGQRLRWRALEGAAVLSILIIAGVLYLQSWVRLPNVPQYPAGVVNPPNSSQMGDLSSGEVEYEGADLPDVTKSGRKEGYYTFLLCGKDVVSGSTDTMILVTYDTKGKRIDAISLLRDTMINVSAKGGSQKRLNTVFTRSRGDRSLSDKERTENGMTALKKEVSKLTGIYPDFYVLVEWEAIGRLVDAIGGVYFDVPPGMDYDDPYQDLHIHQEPGYRLLDGQDAMEVVRFRKSNKGDPNFVSLGDSGRTQIQRDFLTAVLKKCLTPEILLKLPNLVQIFTENVETDLTVGNILAFAQLAIGMDAENNVEFVPMPYYNIMYGGASLVCVQQDEMLKILNDGINPYLDDIKASDLQLMYRKSGGGFGVTNASLLDAAVASPPPPREEEPEEEPGEDPVEDPEGNPGNPDSSGEGGGDVSQPPEGSGDQSNPEGPGDSSSEVPPETPGGEEPGEDPQNPSQSSVIPSIDPADIFPEPEPSQDIREPV